MKKKAQDLTQEEMLQGFYIDGQWKGRDKYQCNFCNWDTLEMDRMLNHLEQGHHFRGTANPKKEVEVQRPVQAELYDASGKPIQTVSEKLLI